ncbi:MAG: helicase-associated domain-containing protein [Anaerolineae bacterium]
MPWRDPQSPLEELYYKGLIYRAYGNIEDYYGEVLWVPGELRDALLLAFAPGNQPDAFHGASNVISHPRDNILVEDLMALLVRTKVGKYRSLKHPGAGIKLPWEYLGIEGRLLGGNDPDYLGFIEELTNSARLVTENEGFLRPSARARTWLKAGYARQKMILYSAWLADANLNIVETCGIHLMGKKALPIPDAKHNLGAVLATLQPDTWFEINPFIKHLQIIRPDYLRSDGDYDSWSVSVKNENQPVRGYASWERIEGALARYLILKPLYWLGIITLGATEDGAQPGLFCLNTDGLDLLNNQTLKPPAVPAPAAVADDSYTISIPIQNTIYERFQLERFSTWQGQTDTARYLLSERSVWEGVNAGITVQQIIRFLERICAGQVSPVMMRALHAWGGHFGRVTLQKAVIIQVVDAETMGVMLKQPDIRRLLGAEVSPTQRLVPTANLAVLIERLKLIGIWPTIKL